MLFKLTKHEFKSSYRNYLPIFVAVIASTLFLILSVSNKSLQGVGYSILITIALITTLYVLMFVNVAKSLGERMYGKPGYLLFTVPAQTKDIVLSRIIANFLWVLLSTLVAAIPLTVFMIYINDLISSQGGQDIGFNAMDIVLAFLGVQGETKTWDITVAIILRMFEFLQLIAALFVSFTVSHTVYRGDKKKLIQFIIFIVLAIGVNLLLSTSLFTTTITSENVYATITYKTTIQKVYAIVFEIVFCSAAFIGSGYLVEKKLELQ